MEYWEEYIAVRENPCNEHGHHVVEYMEFHFRFTDGDETLGHTVARWLAKNVRRQDVVWTGLNKEWFKPPFIVSLRYHSDALKLKLSL